MIKQCKILNKETGEIFQGDLDLELVGLDSYPFVEVDENSDESKAKVLAQENAMRKTQLEVQLEELDKKSIRAMREPSVKDESTGQTWLEFYNAQILDLRAQLTALA